MLYEEEARALEYYPIKFRSAFVVRRLVSVLYREFAVGYEYRGESHPFWELVYVDKGNAEIGCDGVPINLREGCIRFHHPGEFHTIRARGPSAPNLIIVAFDCASPLMRHFRHFEAALDNEEKRMLGRIINEAPLAFWPKAPGSYYPLELREDMPPWSLQWIRLQLEALLIHLCRRMANPPPPGRTHARRPTAPLARYEYDADMVRRIEQFMTQHMARDLKLSDICQHFSMAPTTLKQLFRNMTGHGIMTHLNHIRVDAAKSLIRQGAYNFTEIAQITGFSSIHYFSRRFKQLTGMSPSEYAHSVYSEVER